jgi:hypothetical protein
MRTLVRTFRNFAFCLLPSAFGIALLASCSAYHFVLPTGAGEPAPDAPSAFAEATTGCRSVRTLTGALHLSGHVGSHRVRLTIQGAVTSANQIRLEWPAPFGPPGFILGGTADRTTLVFPRDNRVLTTRAEDILEALIGLKLGPRLLLAVLSGCGAEESQVTSAAKYGDLLAVTTADARVFIRQRGSQWRVVAADVGGLIVDYLPNDDVSLRQLRLSSAAGRVPVIALSVSLSQVEINASVAASTFTVAIPPGSAALTLEELRAAGPLGDKKQ